jgi:hypothetical protein
MEEEAMSKFTEHAKKASADHEEYADKAVENFMGGVSYTLNPLDTLKIVAASSIFGEPSYYRASHAKKSYLKNLSPLYGEPEDTTVSIFSEAIDDSLDYNFKGTLTLAKELREEYFMRLNPAVILIRAALHEKRVEFNRSNPRFMRGIGDAIIVRPDDITNQFEYYMFLNRKKNNLPNIIKRICTEGQYLQDGPGKKFCTLRKYPIYGMR